jgi:hypothetical protein
MTREEIKERLAELATWGLVEIKGQRRGRTGELQPVEQVCQATNDQRARSASSVRRANKQ